MVTSAMIRSPRPRGDRPARGPPDSHHPAVDENVNGVRVQELKDLGVVRHQQQRPSSGALLPHLLDAVGHDPQGVDIESGVRSSSSTASSGSSNAIWRISFRFFSPPENPRSGNARPRRDPCPGASSTRASTGEPRARTGPHRRGRRQPGAGNGSRDRRRSPRDTGRPGRARPSPARREPRR